MVKFRWETHGGLLGRGAMAVAIVLATTFSGLSSEHAAASTRRAVASVPEKVNPAEVVFAFGDDLDAVNYEVGFDPASRDAGRLIAACKAVFADESGFQATLHAIGKAKDIANDLLAAAEPTIELCFDPLTADENAEAAAAEGFANFHESAFDFANALDK